MAWNFNCFVVFTSLLLASQVEGQCGDRAVRLVGGSSDNMGKVEVCVGGEWGTVCNDTWDNEDAAVVCRQLGYCSEGANASSHSYSGAENGTILVNCIGQEESLFDCEFDSQHHCNDLEAASVICTVCCDGDIRLENGPTIFTGRLEVCLGKWGSVCDDGFEEVDASVACGQLGFYRSHAKIFKPDVYGSSFVMDDVNCSGMENQLTECGYNSKPNCYFTETVGVKCKVEDPPLLTLLQAERTNASQIQMSWELWGEKSHDAPVTSYTVKYYPLSPDTHVQQSFEKFLTTKETEMVIWNLDPGVSYSISVAANNGAGRGNYTYEVIVECKCFIKECLVISKEGEPTFCKTPLEPDKSLSSTCVQGTSTPTHRSSTPTQGTSTPVVTNVAFAAVVVVAFALVLVLVVCIVTVAVLRKKAHHRPLRISQGKPLSASNIQALDERFVGTKDVDGCNDVTLHNSTDGAGMDETILEYPAPSFSLHDENSMPKPPAACVDPNPYETIPELSGNNASLFHTDFNEEPPYQYTTPGSLAANVNSLSQYQKLMVGLETPAYAALQKVQKLDVNTTHEECRVALGVDQTSCGQNGVEGNGTENSYATLLTVTKEDENEYSSLMIRP